MSKKSFSEYCAGDADLRRLKALQDTNDRNLFTTTTRISDIEAVVENPRGASAMADAILAGEAPQTIDMVGMRSDLDHLRQHLEAYELAGAKIRSSIEDRRGHLVRAYISSSLKEERCANVARLIDGFLSIAEANVAEKRIFDELQADGAPDMFRPIQFIFGSFPGRWHTYIEQQIDFYGEQLGYRPTSAQRERLKELADAFATG